MGTKFTRSVTVALVAGAVALSMTTTASAATRGVVTLDGGTLRFEAGRAAVNDVSITPSGAWTMVTDAATPLVAGAPCVQTSPNTALCPVDGVSQLEVILGDLDDQARNGDPRIGSRNENIHGGRGNDTIEGGPANSEIWGGPGNDTINGNGGDDTLIGEDGNDKLDGGVHVGGDFGNGGNDSDTCVNLELGAISCEA